jgi:hypothetical protein
MSRAQPASPISTPDPIAVMPDAPPVLKQRIQEAIDAVDSGRSLATASPEMLLRAAEWLFARALRSGCTERASAVALLAVDALVTSAFERASDEPAQLEDRAERAMAALAALSVPLTGQ